MVITIPHKYQPRKYQLPFLKAFDNGIKRFILCWHRRSGKDKTVFAVLSKRMLEKKGLYLYILPYYSQAKKIIWHGIDKDGFKFLDHFPKEITKSVNETEMRIELINGSILQLVGADKVDSIVGTNPIGVVFSEYSLMKSSVWDFIRPILAENGGWAVFVFTPRGMNHAWKLIQQAKETKDWFVQLLTVEDTQAISKEVLEAEKREMPQDLFEQEYYVKFIEGAGAFFRRIDNNKAVVDPKPDPQRRYKMGVDLAKYQDYTVITIIDLMNFNVILQERFNQIDYNLQKAKIEAIYFKYFKPLVYIDSTGVGEPVYDDLVKTGMNIQPYKFTEQSRKDLLVNLQLRLEQGTIKIPDDDILTSELKSFQYTITEGGKVKIQVPDGVHDDCVFSLALACWELPQNPLPKAGSIWNLTKKQEEHQTSYE